MGDALRDHLQRALGSRFELEELLGSGGFAHVFAARDHRLERRVAVKLLRPEITSDESLQRFLREAKTVAKLEHPNIVPIYTVEEGDGLVWFMMPLMRGATLRDLIKSDRKLSPREVQRMLAEAAEALAAAHEAGVIHRDLKPENVMLTKENRVMLTDFGIAKVVTQQGDGTLTGPHELLGTPRYMSPEQAVGSEIDERTDIYSLGCIGFELLSGRPPFEGTTVGSLIAQHAAEDPPDVRKLKRGLPEPLAAAVMRCLEKRPSARWPTARALAHALKKRKPRGASGPVGNQALVESQELKDLTGRLTPIVVVVALVGVGMMVRDRIRERRVDVPAVEEPRPALQWEPVTALGTAGRPSVSPDGRRVAFVETGPGTEDSARVVVQELASGIVEFEVRTPANPAGPIWASDGSEIWVGAAEPPGLTSWYAHPLAGSNPRAVVSADHVSAAPDGRRIAYALHSGARCCWVRDVVDGDSTWIQSFGGEEWIQGLSWSPASDVLAVVVIDRATGRRRGLWTLRVAGAKWVRRFRVASWASVAGLGSVDWSPDGAAIYYDRGGEVWRVDVDPDTGEPPPDARNRPTGIRAVGPFSVMPDGSSAILARRRAGVATWLHELGPDGVSPQGVRLSADTLYRPAMVLSPDRNRVAVSEFQGPGRLRPLGISVITVADRTTREVTRAAAYQLAWSPDGTRIAFAGDYGAATRIFVVTPGEGLPRLVGGRNTDLEPDLHWCSNGEILYQISGNTNLVAVDPRTRSERELFSRRGGWVFSPRCSPGGDHVAVWWNRARNADGPGVWIVTVEGEPVRQLTRDTESTYWPIGWSPDGSRVFLEEATSGRLFRVRASGGPLENLSGDVSGSARDVTSDASRVLIAREESGPSYLWRFRGLPGSG